MEAAPSVLRPNAETGERGFARHSSEELLLDDDDPLSIKLFYKDQEHVAYQDEVNSGEYMATFEDDFEAEPDAAEKISESLGAEAITGARLSYEEVDGTVESDVRIAFAEEVTPTSVRVEEQPDINEEAVSSLEAMPMVEAPKQTIELEHGEEIAEIPESVIDEPTEVKVESKKPEIKRKPIKSIDELLEDVFSAVRPEASEAKSLVASAKKQTAPQQATVQKVSSKLSRPKRQQAINIKPISRVANVADSIRKIAKPEASYFFAVVKSKVENVKPLIKRSSKPANTIDSKAPAKTIVKRTPETSSQKQDSIGANKTKAPVREVIKKVERIEEVVRYVERRVEQVTSEKKAANKTPAVQKGQKEVRPRIIIKKEDPVIVYRTVQSSPMSISSPNVYPSNETSQSIEVIDSVEEIVEELIQKLDASALSDPDAYDTLHRLRRRIAALQNLAEVIRQQLGRQAIQAIRTPRPSYA